MVSKEALRILGLLAIVAMISTEVAARNLGETSSNPRIHGSLPIDYAITDRIDKTYVGDIKYNKNACPNGVGPNCFIPGFGIPGFGMPGGGMPGGGAPGGGAPGGGAPGGGAPGGGAPGGGAPGGGGHGGAHMV
ncbi:cold and drought-regulated protein CORA-like [Gastrolobium bilobum]|uniref:cold and drought-regulated protein CORA-like n=1 Tax=Gastrolobium bilobum TaxID=150636 RepID=UPI002AB2953E|nr:cold and drought-regulated protein CORA-like [Gastrolobium bilobum]